MDRILLWRLSIIFVWIDENQKQPTRWINGNNDKTSTTYK